MLGYRFDGPTVLDGIRVVEVAEDPAGELVGRLLAQLGADVAKIEPPLGSSSRRIGPFTPGAAAGQASLHFWHYNANKRSVVVDMPETAGLGGLEPLLAEADLLVIDLSPSELARRGIDLDRTAQAFPRLVVASVTPFGLTGPWRDHRSSDLVALAAGGPLHMCGYDDHTIPPIRPGGNQGFHTAAAFALIGVMLALIHRQTAGHGDVVDVSMHEAMAVTVELANPYWFYPRMLVHRQTCRHAQPGPTKPALFRCGDGRYVFFALILADDKPWRSLVQWLDDEGGAASLADPAFEDVAHRQAQFDLVQAVIEDFFGRKDAEHLYHEGQKRGLPIGIVNAPEEVLADAHLVARGFFQTVDHDGVGPVPHLAAPIAFSGLAQRAPAPAPVLGQHTSEPWPAFRPVAAGDARPS